MILTIRYSTGMNHRRQLRVAQPLAALGSVLLTRSLRQLAVAVAVGAAAALTGACSNGSQALDDVPPIRQSKAAVPIPTQDPAAASVALGAPMAPLTEPGAGPRAPVKVGLILPLTGPGQAAVIASSMKQAAELALKDLNATHVQLIVKDDKGTPEGATVAATEALSDGVELILGPLYARSVSATSAVARAKSVPVVAFSNDRQVAGSAAHLLSFLAGPEVRRVVNYAAQKGKRRYVALIPDDSYGKLVEPSFREAVARAGGTVVASESYPSDGVGRTSSILAIVKQLRDQIVSIEGQGNPIDALFIPGGDDTVQLLGPLLKQAGIDTKRIQIIGTGALDTPNAGRDDAFVGAWYAAPDPHGFKDFAEKFGRAYGQAPPRISSLAYDAAGLAAALATGPDGGRFIPSALTRASGFNGVDGLFRLMSDGLTERALAILEVQKFGGTVIDAPPTNLDGSSAVPTPQPGAAIVTGATSGQGQVSRIDGG